MISVTSLSHEMSIDIIFIGHLHRLAVVKNVVKFVVLVDLLFSKVLM